MNRLEWQQIAEEKLLAADALLAASQWASAYYLAGYAVECGLKSCILVRLAASPGLIFESKKLKTFSTDCWVHDLEALMKLAGLGADHQTAIATDSVLATNWALVKDWGEDTRYALKAESQARNLYHAITDPVSGVMQWIKARW